MYNRLALIMIVLLGCGAPSGDGPPPVSIDMTQKRDPPPSMSIKVCGWTGCKVNEPPIGSFDTDLMDYQRMYPGKNATGGMIVQSGVLCTNGVGGGEIKYIKVSLDFLLEIHYYKDGVKITTISWSDSIDQMCGGKHYKGLALPAWCCQ